MKNHFLLSNTYIKLFCFIIFLLSVVLETKAEGTRQTQPDKNTPNSLRINGKTGTNTGNNYGYNAGALERLYVHIKDFNTETIYLGFQTRFNSDYYMRIKDPNGTVVFGPVVIPRTSGAVGYIETYEQAINGPNQINGGGYNAFEYMPTMNGDYYIEFNAFTPITPSNFAFDLTYYDITVANTMTNTAIDGRLFSYVWAFNTLSFGNESRATFYAYTADSVVTTLNLNGMRPFVYGVFCNRNGALDTMDFTNDRKSTTFRPDPTPEFRLFLADPDQQDFPSTIFPSLTSPPTISGCPSTGFCVELSVTKNASSEVILDFNANGVFDEGTRDVLLTGEIIKGTNCIPWDGLDGLGAPISVGDNITGFAQAIAGLTNFPVWDAEANDNGVQVAIIRPTAAPPLVFWDDTNLTAGTKELSGVNSPAHAWGGSLGNNRLINTWWYTFTINERFDYIITSECPPIANPDIVEACPGSTLTINPLTNDSDSESNLSPNSLSIITAPQNGSATVSSGGIINYTPNLGYTGPDEIIYQVCDITGLCSSVAGDGGKITINSGADFQLSKVDICGGSNGIISFPTNNTTYTYGFSSGNTYTGGATTVPSLNGTNTINGLTAGTYTIRLDNGSCFNDQTITIDGNAGPPFTLDYVRYCLGRTSLIFDTTTDQFFYDFSEGTTYTGQEIPSAFKTINGTNRIDQVINRNYTVRLYDPNTGCFTDQTILVVRDNTTAPEINNVLSNSSCGANGTGSIQFDATAGHTYNFVQGSFYNGEPYPTNFTVPVSGTAIINNLTPGNYTIRLLIAGGTCYRDRSVIVPNQQPFLSLTKKDICDASMPSTGSISFSTTSTAFSYGISDGSTFDTSNPVNINTINGTNEIINQTAGTYTVRLLDNSTGCFTDQTIIIENAEPLTLNLSKTESCGANNGSISFATAEAGLKYDFTIGGTSYSGPNPPTANTTLSGAANFINNLNPGTYHIKLFDPNTGCDTESSITIAGATAPSLSLSATDATCKDGSISFTTTAGLNYAFNAGGAYNGNPSPSTLATTAGINTIDNLSEGIYTVRLFDSTTGCFTDSSIIIAKKANCPPIVQNNTFEGKEDQMGIIIPSITSNDQDIDGSIDVSTVDLDPSTSGIQTSLNNAQGSWSVDNAANVTFVPAADYFGTANLDYVVNDNDGGTSPVAQISVDVLSINDEPSFVKGLNVSIGENTASHTLNNWATMIDKGATNESTQTLFFTLTNDNNSLFSTQPTIDPATGNLSFIVANNSNGTATVSVILTDSGGTMNGGDDTFATQTFTITVTPQPTLALNTKTNASTCGGTGEITLTSTNVPDGLYTINYLDASNANQTFTNVNFSSNTATISSIAVGTYNDIAIMVNGSTSSENIDLIIEEPARPTVNLASDDSDNLLFVGQSVTFTATGTALTNFDFLVNGISVQNGSSSTFSSSILNNNDQVSVVGTNGNNCSTTSAAIQVMVDATPPPAPTSIMISEDTNDDGVLNKSENDADLNATLSVVIGIPASGVVAGDVLVVNGNEVVINASNIGNSITVDFPKPTEGNSLTVIANIKDVAGNESTTNVSDSIIIDTAAPSAPIVVITEDANNDGIINVSEKSGDNDVTITLPADAVAGDILTINGTNQTLTAAQITSGSVTTTVPDPTSGSTISVTVSVTDQAGNKSIDSTDSATLDNTPPSAPTITFTQDTNTDGNLNSAEIGSATSVEFSIAIPSDVNAGDQINYNGTLYTINATDKTDGNVTFNIANPGDGNTANITAFFIDVAGNSGATTNGSVAIDTTPPVSPTVVILEDLNNDGLINTNELTAPIQIEIDLPTGTTAGQLITITGQTERAITASEATAGKIDVDFPSPGEGNTITVTASIKDSAGNPSMNGADSAVIDTTPESAPTVTINEDTNNNGFIGGTELSGDINVTVQLPASTVAGMTLIFIQDIDGNSTTTNIALAQSDIDAGSISRTIPQQGDAVVVTATASVTDLAGNPGTQGSDTATVDTSGPAAPTLSFTEDADGNGIVGPSEQMGDFDIAVTLPKGLSPGDMLTVGSTTLTLTTAQITAGTVNVSIPQPAEGNQTITAFITDVNGNKGSETNPSISIDTTAPSTPTATITEDANNDGTINASEKSGAIDVSITLPSDAVAGDLLTINGTDQTLTAADITNSSVTATVPDPVAPSTTVSVTVSITDQAGNKSTDRTDTANLDATPPTAPTITFSQDANTDGIINNTELGTATTINFSITIPSDVNAGDQINYNSTMYTITVTDKTAGSVPFNILNPGNGNTATVNAFFIDAAGNTGTTTNESVVIDTTPPAAPTVVILEDTNNDGFMTATELSGDIQVEVDLPTGTIAGQLITITGQIERAVTAAEAAAGKIDIDFPSPGEGNTITVTTSIKDAAGNASIDGSDSAVVDTTAPNVPIITVLEDSNNDMIISDSELNGLIDVRISIPLGGEVGDELIFDSQAPYILTAADIINGYVDRTILNPGEGGTRTLTANYIDRAGNFGPSATTQFTVDTIGPLLPNVAISEDKNNDGILNKTELDQANTDGGIDYTIDISGLTAMDEIEINGMRRPITSAEANTGIITGQINIPTPSEGETVTLTVKAFDNLGNGSVEKSDSAKIDTIPKPSVTININEDVNGDGIVTANEINGDINFTISLPTEAEIGDVLTINRTEQTLTATDIAQGQIATSVANPGNGNQVNITVTLTDQDGNISDPSNAGVIINTSVPVINSGSQNIKSPIVSGTAQPNETLKISIVINGTVTTYETTTDANGNWVINLNDATPTSGTKPVLAEGTSIDISVEDSAGNIGNGTITIEVTKVDLEITSSVLDSSPFKQDNTVRIRIEVKNNGTGIAENTFVSISIPEGIKIIDLSELVNGNWEIGTLNPNGTVSIIIEINLTEVGDKTLNFEVNNLEIDTDLRNNKSENTITIVSPDSQVLQDQLEIPKAFTPNGDLENNEWVIKGIENFPNNSISIINRWGNKVFEIDGYNNTDKVWNGISNGKLVLGSGTLVPDGTYFYILDLGIGQKPLKGFVMIVK